MIFNLVRFLALMLLLLLIGLGISLLLLRDRDATLNKAARNVACARLAIACRYYLDHGEITNSAGHLGQVFPYTNIIAINNTNYQCMLGMAWYWRCPTGTIVAATSDGKQAIWIEPGRPLRIVPMSR